MDNRQKIPPLVIPRLSLYYRAMLESRGIDFISSEEIARLTNLTAAQVRRDLTYFGQFGIPRKGYKIEVLKKRILNILGTDRKWKVVLVGVGNLGSALISYRGFGEQGFEISCAFDNDAKKIGKKISGVEILDITELTLTVKDRNIKMAIVAVPVSVVQEVVNTLIKAGVRSILNFAPARPQVPDNVELLNIDLSIELERLAFFLRRRRGVSRISSRSRRNK